VRAAASGLAVVIALTVPWAASAGDETAKAAARTFGRALVTGSAEALRPILPEKGRVHLTLIRLGPEEGLFGARQVEALFRDFLAGGKVASFDLGRCDSDAGRSALAHGQAAITDRDGRSRRIGLHLAFEREGERWRLVIENHTRELEAADLRALAEPFWRKERARSDRNRTGLGLALSRALADKSRCSLEFALEGETFRASLTG